jgi:hypothetical protein
MIQGDGGCCKVDRPKVNPFSDPLSRPNHYAHDALGDPAHCMGDHNHPAGRPPGYYALLWANHERNGMSWDDILELHKQDVLAEDREEGVNG